MLSERARKAVDLIMRCGCFLKIYPYQWDSKSFRLKYAPRWHMLLYHVRRYFVLVTFSFMLFRLVSSLKSDMPSRIRIMNIIWVAAYSLVVMCNIQFERRRGALLFFTNALMSQLDRNRAPPPQNVKKKPSSPSKEKRDRNPTDKHKEEVLRQQGKNKSFDWISPIVLLSTFLLFTNPPAHSTVLFDIPCAPQYMSSLVFACTTPSDDPAPAYLKGLFVLLENWIISDMMFAWTFNWAVCFLGLTWIKLEVRRFQQGNVPPNLKAPLDFDAAIRQYRYIQSLVAVINDANRLYLQFFPSVLFTIAGMLLFGTIRYTALPFHAYVVFPFCGIRCIFEAGTALGAAGLVNQESKIYLMQWDRELDRVPDPHERKYLRTFRNSCNVLKCMAGSLYSFENSIVLTSLSNCALLTFNMFVTFKTASI